MNNREPTEEELEAWNLAQIKQRPSRLQAKSIRSVMRRLMSQRDYAAIQATASLQDVWSAIVGQPLANATRPGKLSRGTLHVAVSNSGAIQELHFRKRDILSALRAQLPESKIEDLKFRVESW